MTAYKATLSEDGTEVTICHSCAVGITNDDWIGAVARLDDGREWSAEAADEAEDELSRIMASVELLTNDTPSPIEDEATFGGYFDCWTCSETYVA